MRHALVAGVGALVLAGLAATGANAAPTLLTVGSFDQPVYVTAPPLDTARVAVVQRAGAVVLLKDGVRQATPFLDLTARVQSNYEEQGLLSIAFAPDYATSRKVYAFYTARSPDGALQVDELTADAAGDHVDASTRRSVITIPHAAYDNHDGGQLQFGPDGMLWLGTGDGGGGGDPQGNGQDTHALLGKLLRVDPRRGDGCGGGCTIPAGNPFADGAGGAPEVWSYGLRNPWRFSFDRATHDLWIGDVGQDCYEEVDRAPAPALGKGANYEWNVMEGFHLYEAGCTGNPLAGPGDRPPGAVDPVIEYQHTTQRLSVTGGYVVRDPNLPSLSGRYVYGDFNSGEVWSVDPAAPQQPRDEPAVATLSSFGEDGCGRLYAASIYGGDVYRFAEDAPGTGACAGPSPPVFQVPGGNPAPPGPGSGGGGGPAADTTAPRLRLRAARRQRLGALRVTAGCDEVCAVVASGRFTIRRGGARRAAAPLRTRTARRTLAEGARFALRLRITKGTRARLLRALRRHRRVTVRFTVVARDTAGNRRAARVSARLVRR